MRPSPFTGKFKKKQIKLQKDKNQQKQEQQIEQPTIQYEMNQLKPPSTKNMIKIGKSKQRQKSKQAEKEKQQQTKKIYDALKEDNEDKLQSKASATFKPNLKLLKGGKKLKLSTHQEQKKEEDQPEQQQQSYRPVLKPNLFKKGDTVNSQRANQREQVVIEQENRYNENRNIEEDSQEGSGSVSQSMSIAPKFKIKNKIQNQQFPVIQEQQFQQTGFNVNNFADLKIQTRQINLDPSETKISASKLQKQQSRVLQLSKLLNLQADLYEQTLNISCTTGYENYINKIKNGTLINSCDQAFDEKMSSGTQTGTLEYEQFTNQCPQDYYMDINVLSGEAAKSSQEDMFENFVRKIAPVFQELIKPSSTVVMPPIFLLALRPSFRKFVCCPFPVFVYFSEALQVGIVVIGEKLYIVEAEVESVLSMGSLLIVGCRDGGIYLWGDKNDKRSRLYRKILQSTQTTNFELPQASNQSLDRFSIYRSHSPICELYCESSDIFTSLDQSSKLTKWRIIRPTTPSGSLTIEPILSNEFSNILQRPNLLSYSLKKRSQMYFICTSIGIIVWNGEDIVQKLDTEGVKVNGFSLPYRTGFVYAVLQDGTMRIYHQNYANQLYKLHIGTQPLTDIHIPETQYENKKLSLTSKIYVTTSESQIYKINFLESTAVPKLITAGASQKQRDVIYKGINKLNHGFQIVSLWKDLKCTTETRKIDVNIESTVGNIKNILEDNRQMHNWLEGQVSVLIVQ